MIESHRTPEAMARVLCSYIACDERVLREVRSEFDSDMGLPNIRRIRAEKQRSDARYRRGRMSHEFTR